MDCVSEDLADQTCPLIVGCETRPVWLKMRDAIVDSLDSMTLADLIAPGQNLGRGQVGRRRAEASALPRAS